MFVKLNTSGGEVVVNTDFIVSFEKHPSNGTIITLSTLSYSKGHLVVNDDFDTLSKLVTNRVPQNALKSVPEVVDVKAIPISIDEINKVKGKT